jgi:hypothetical protein
MPFDPKSPKKVGKKSKRGPAKKEGLYERDLDDLLRNQDKITKTQRVKAFGTHSRDIFPKTKFIRDKCTLEKLKEKKENLFNQDSYPTK